MALDSMIGKKPSQKIIILREICVLNQGVLSIKSSLKENSSSRTLVGFTSRQSLLALQTQNRLKTSLHLNVACRV